MIESPPPIAPAIRPETASRGAGQAAPFLLWPVSRREFYRGIWVALLLPMVWGVILFGIRPLAMLVAASLAATASHVLLKRVFRWKRAQELVYQHSLVGAMVMVALAQPSWPGWIIASLAFLLPFAYAAMRGPGRERVHIAVAAILLVQYVLLPTLKPITFTQLPDAILARDRLVFGDIRDLPPHGEQISSTFPAGTWPISRDLRGNDAVRFNRPAVVAAGTLNEVANALPSASLPHPAELAPETLKDIREILDHAFVYDLPSVDLFYLGVAPNRIGAASLIGILIAGLFLSYRYILRPRSACLFLVVFAAASLLLAFTPNTIQHVGVRALWQVVRAFPAELLSLVQLLLFNSDAPFAAVFILALPGTEPLTPRGRRYFLALAALLAAALHRLDPATPTATLSLCLLMPVAPLFDRFLARKSWLHGRRDPGRIAPARTA